MKASNFSGGQKAFILKQGDDGVPATALKRNATNKSLGFEASGALRF